MYRIVKERGNNSNVAIENLSTKESIILGRLSMDMLGILEKEGIHFGESDEEIKLKDKWDFEVSEDTGRELIRKKAFSLAKPKRDQSKKVEQKKENNKKIDAMDVLLGLASYN